MGGPTCRCTSTECMTRFLLSGVTGQMDVLHISVRKAAPDDVHVSSLTFLLG